MTSADLTRAQAARLEAGIARDLRFLNALCRRAQQLGWPLEDPLVVAANRARGSVQDLLAAVRYAAIKRGVGRAATDEG